MSMKKKLSTEKQSVICKVYTDGELVKEYTQKKYVYVHADGSTYINWMKSTKPAYYSYIDKKYFYEVKYTTVRKRGDMKRYRVKEIWDKYPSEWKDVYIADEVDAEIAELVEQIETTRNVLTVLLVSIDELINKYKGE